MDYLIRCPACTHGLADHDDAHGCSGANARCRCRYDRNAVLMAVVRHDASRWSRAALDEILNRESAVAPDAER